MKRQKRREIAGESKRGLIAVLAGRDAFVGA
jgi:hypothetical protein